MPIKKGQEYIAKMPQKARTHTKRYTEARAANYI